MDSQRTLVQSSPPPSGGGQSPLRARRITARKAHAAQAWAQGPEHTGELLLGRYRLLECLGAGGFGVVWRAHDELLERDVALKRIPLGPDGDVERAAREAHAAARLSHPAIVALHEACSGDGCFYLVSELVEGATLARLIVEDALSDEQVIEIGLALVAALAHAHARGVIHRDIKPQNVLVPERCENPGEAAKLTDFGGASLVGEEALTRTGNVLGTLAYMAPEQSEGAEVDEQADLYALALVLYEALSGVNPVRGATPAATVKRIGMRVESLHRRRRDLPRALCEAVSCALAPRPEQRGSLEQLGAALEDALAEIDGEDPAPRRVRGVRAAREERERARAGRPARREMPDGARDQDPAPEPARRAASSVALALPRRLCVLALLALAVWAAATGRSGVGLVLIAAMLPALLVRAPDLSARVPLARLLAALAPALGLVGLAGAFPALAGQQRPLRERALLGALGYWWLALAGRALGRTLWLASGSHEAWRGSVVSAATRVIAPSLSPAMALGALVWALAAAALPLLARGRRALLDIAAVSLWAAALVLLEVRLDSGLSAAAHPGPRGALLGAALGALAAIAARAVRGPV